MSKRSKARELAVQMLYMIDINPDADAKAIRATIEEQLGDFQLAEFSWSLFIRVREVRSQLDASIESVAMHWKISRMPPTDRNIIRLGTFELMFTDTPPKVVIDEAVELAKRYGTAQSSQFVNGILDRLIPESKRTTPAGVHPEIPLKLKDETLPDAADVSIEKKEPLSTDEDDDDVE
ncbi:MAG: transcription antitermination factor NusB [Planctomycetota bacterium]|nr:transcription antitermination factor NusB [Planctomycetota bacterium]MDA1210898.1 transcription antitermination factor NusB [Planctomycetota bacterium]